MVVVVVSGVVVMLVMVVVEGVDPVPSTSQPPRHARPPTPNARQPLSPLHPRLHPHISHGKGCRMRAFRFQIEQLIPRYYPEVSIAAVLEERLGRDGANCGEGIRGREGKG